MGAWKVSKLWFTALLPVVFVAGCGREPGTVLATLRLVSPNAPLLGEWA
jgi:hypothetical protein